MADESSYETHYEETTERSHKKKKKKSKRKRVDLSVEYVKEAPERIAPVIGYFSTGYNPPEPNDNDVKMFQHKRHASRVELIVRPSESKNIEFVGTSYRGEAEHPQICTYVLGVVDKESQTLKVVPIAGNKIVRLEPYFAKEESSHVEKSEITEATASGKVERKMSDLTNMFGARKDKINQKRMQNLFEQINTEVPDVELIGATQDNNRSEAKMDAAGNLSSLNIPPHDPSADKPELVYRLDRIIPRGERPYLLNILDDVKNKKKYPSFVANRMHQLKSLSGEKSEEFACVLSYISHLITFWEKFSASKWKHAHKSTDDNRTTIPQIVFQKLMTLFMNSDSHVLSTEKQELLIGYILVLTLFADNFHSDTTDIAKDLKMSWAKLKPYYLQLGCKAKGTYVTLPVPLHFPDMKRKKTKRSGQ